MWIPAGASADAEIDGFGDIANFPAASISATLHAPADSVVVTGGVRISEDTAGGASTLVEGGVGLRDLGVVVLRGGDQQRTTAGDVEVVVTAPAGTPDADVVAALAATSLTTLADSFGAYPWAEVDVVATPLGSGVGGMEWPGMVWIESTVFAGGVPGLGELGDLSDLLGDTDGLDELLGGAFGDVGLQIETMRDWTIAHELGHLWWHALVGNDSISEPVIDEPLAQHSACLVVRVLRPAEAGAVCDAHWGTIGMWAALADSPGWRLQ